MKDRDKTKSWLIAELEEMRRRVLDLENGEPHHIQEDRKLLERDVKFRFIYDALSGFAFTS